MSDTDWRNLVSLAHAWLDDRNGKPLHHAGCQCRVCLFAREILAAEASQPKETTNGSDQIR